MEPYREVSGDLLAHLDRLTGLGVSPDGDVRVVIDGSGVPTEMTIQPGAMRRRPQALAAAVVAALREARGDLDAQVARTIENLATIEASGGAGVAPTSVQEVARRADQLADEVAAARRKLSEVLGSD